jgi:hypothetical protein
MASATIGGLMNSQSKLDLIAGGAILAMFMGAYMLTVSRWGLAIIIGGIVVMLVLYVKTLRTDQ